MTDELKYNFVPCSERLPPEGLAVIVRYPNGYGYPPVWRRWSGVRWEGTNKGYPACQGVESWLDPGGRLSECAYWEGRWDRMLEAHQRDIDGHMKHAQVLGQRIDELMEAIAERETLIQELDKRIAEPDDALHDAQEAAHNYQQSTEFLNGEIKRLFGDVGVMAKAAELWRMWRTFESVANEDIHELGLHFGGSVVVWSDAGEETIKAEAWAEAIAHLESLAQPDPDRRVSVEELVNLWDDTAKQAVSDEGVRFVNIMERVRQHGIKPEPAP